MGKGIEMGRLALLGLIAIAVVMVGNDGLPTLHGLEDKFWLVALFPAVYILGYVLLKD